MRAASWIFRVGSRPEDGGGHVNRCVALARAMSRHASVLFIVDCEGGDWIPWLDERGFRAVLEGAEGAGPWAGCILDGYSFSEADAAGWKARAERLVVIDDFNSPPRMADLAICLLAAAETPRINDVPVLAGPRYALIMPHYASSPTPVTPSRVEQVLVCFGLRDSKNTTTLTVAALGRLGDEGFAPRITVALGSEAPHLETVRSALAALSERANLVTDAPGLAELLAHSDLVIGAGGVALLERLASGVPSVTVTLADNQRGLAELAARHGATLVCGRADAVGAEDLAHAIAELAGDRNRRAAMAEAGRVLVDGRGAARAAKAIFGSLRNTRNLVVNCSRNVG